MRASLSSSGQMEWKQGSKATESVYQTDQVLALHKVPRLID